MLDIEVLKRRLLSGNTSVVAKTTSRQKAYADTNNVVITSSIHNLNTPDGYLMYIFGLTPMTDDYVVM
jgi:hypothetical protein